jgi:hypothetical protein
MKANGGVEVYIHIFLTSVLAGGEWSASRFGPQYPFDRRLGGPLSRFGWYKEEKYLLPLPSIEP